MTRSNPRQGRASIARAPRLRPDARVGHREGVLDGVFAAPGEPLDDVPVFAQRGTILLGADVLGLDDERVSIPPSTRHAKPLPDLITHVGLIGHRDDAKVVDLFLKDDDMFGRLQDLDVVVVAAWSDWHSALDDAAGVEAIVLRTIRRRKFPIDGLQPLRLRRRLVSLPACRPGRQATVRGICDKRRPSGRGAKVPPDLVEVEGEVELRTQLTAALGGCECRPLEVFRRHLLRGQPLPPGVFHRVFV